MKILPTKGLTTKKFAHENVLRRKTRLTEESRNKKKAQKIFSKKSLPTKVFLNIIGSDWERNWRFSYEIRGILAFLATKYAISYLVTKY